MLPYFFIPVALFFILNPRFAGLLMFGSYSVCNIIVLLNMLIAMMSNSYQVGGDVEIFIGSFSFVEYHGC